MSDGFAYPAGTGKRGPKPKYREVVKHGGKRGPKPGRQPNIFLEQALMCLEKSMAFPDNELSRLSNCTGCIEIVLIGLILRLYKTR